MPISRTQALTLCCELMLLSCSKEHGGQTGDEDALPGDEFYADFGKGQGFGNYQPATGVDDMVARSELVVSGHGVALRPGRKFVLASGVETTMYETVVLELAVERTFKGPDTESLFLEFFTGVSAARATEQLPHDRVVAFAIRVGDKPQLVGTEVSWEDAGILFERDGLPDGALLYQLTTPQGFAVANKDGGFSQPFEPRDDVLGGGDLDALIARIEQALETAATLDAAVADGGSTPDGSAAGDASSPTADAGSCAGEATVCPASCTTVNAIPYDATNACLDYGAGIVVGCAEGVGPPVTVCIERVADGARFMVGQGWPFPTSSIYRTCPDDTGNAVLTAPSC